MTTIWCVTPVYFDVTSFLRLRTDVLEALKGYGCAVKFLVVDDSAGEDPAIDTLRATENTSVVESPVNLGHQRALVFGLRLLAREVGDDSVIVTLDSDGEDQPSDIPRLIDAFRQSPNRNREVFIARRIGRTTSLKFKVLYFGFQILTKLLIGIKIRSGNFACYSSALLKRIIFHPTFDRCYSTSLIVLRLGKQFVPCRRGSRYSGQSKMTTVDLMIHGYRMMMPFLDRISVRLLFLVAAFCGLLLAMIFSSLATLLINEYDLPSGFFTLLICVLFLCVILLSNFILLFAVFAQSESVSFQGIERKWRAQTPPVKLCGE